MSIERGMTPDEIFATLAPEVRETAREIFDQIEGREPEHYFLCTIRHPHVGFDVFVSIVQAVFGAAFASFPQEFIIACLVLQVSLNEHAMSRMGFPHTIIAMTGIEQYKRLVQSEGEMREDAYRDVLAVIQEHRDER